MIGKTVSIFSGALTTTTNSPDFDMSPGSNGLVLLLSITVATGTTPTLDLKVQEKDEINGIYIDVPGAAFAQKTGTGTARLVIHPAVTGSANVAISQIIGKTYRVVATVGGTTPSLTFTLTANYTS